MSIAIIQRRSAEIRAMKTKTKARRNIFRRIHNGSKLKNPQLVKTDILKFLLILPLNNEGIEKLFLLCEYFYVAACWIQSRNPCDKYHIDKAQVGYVCTRALLVLLQLKIKNMKIILKLIRKFFKFCFGNVFTYYDKHLSKYCKQKVSRNRALLL